MRISSTGQAIAPGNQFERLFPELYLRNRQPLFSYAMSIVNRQDVAEDIVQDVFAKFWSGREKYASVVEDYTAFLFRMVHNEAITYLRRERQKQLVFKNVSVHRMDSLNLTEEILYQKELEVLLQLAIQKLSPQCKKVYLLAKMEALPLEKVAVILGVSYQTVKNQVRTANLEIRKYFNNSMGTERKKKCKATKLKGYEFQEMKSLKAA